MLYGPGNNTFSNQIGNTLIMQLEGSSCIKIAGGATRTVQPEEIELVDCEREFQVTRGAGAKVLRIVMGTAPQ